MNAPLTDRLRIENVTARSHGVTMRFVMTKGGGSAHLMPPEARDNVYCGTGRPAWSRAIPDGTPVCAVCVRLGGEFIETARPASSGGTETA